MRCLIVLLLAVVPIFAHFTLDYPPPTGFDEDKEPTPPCGGFNPTVSNATNWPLSGGEIVIDSHHPQMTILYRAQLMGDNTWVNLTDGFLLMTGLGKLCIKSGAVPSDWNDKIGVVQTI